MRSYTQIDYDERVKIYQLKHSGQSISQIASTLKRSKSTISRELKRNEAPPGEYWPDTAQGKMLKRRRRGCLLERHSELREFVETMLTHHYWTPEQISGYLRHRQEELPFVCHETIYAWIYAPSQKAKKVWKYLPRHKARRGLRKSRGAGKSRIPHRVSIHERPESVEKKQEFGHWEGDLMAFRKNSQHILVLRERKTMFSLSVPLDSKKADETSARIINLLKELPLKARKSITFDNGGEFAAHKDICDALQVQTFFCDPYCLMAKGRR
jgi:transposase, IS30 family